MFDPNADGRYTVKVGQEGFGLSNLAATTVRLLGYEPPVMWDEAILE